MDPESQLVIVLICVVFVPFVIAMFIKFPWTIAVIGVGLIAIRAYIKHGSGNNNTTSRS